MTRESNLDKLNARYYASTAGRFMSPDWSAKPQGVPYAQLADPQSLNLYVYVRDNPITGLDLDGHAGGQSAWEQCATSTPSCKTQGHVADNGNASIDPDRPAVPPAKVAQQQHLAGTIYNETGGFRPQVGKNGKPDPASTATLTNGRKAVGEVDLNREAAGKTGGVASSEVTKLGRATSQYADSLTAAKEAIAVGGSKTGPQHYYFRSGPLTMVGGKVTAGDQPWWARGVVPAASYGPFRNPVQVGDVAAGNDVYIDIYNVP